MIIACIAGMPGSGKSIVAKAAGDLGLPVYNMGDIVREETLKRYGAITPELIRRTSIDLRKEYGDTVVADRTLERIKEEHCLVVIDGVRSLKEIEVFSRRGSVFIVAVHASPRIRFKRILERKRAGDPSTWEEFRARDLTELSFGIGDVIALADFMIVNEGTVDEAYKRAREILEGLRKLCMLESKQR